MEKKNETIYRPPVVVILGHIDHGKTTLLTAIRDFKVLEKESGGITQHVGAYQVIHDGRKITFIDTPGHESFSAIRARGSNLADIAVLVIDAVEGVKKQTKEAIEHIKKANISTIVALNKMDKPGADPEMVKQQLFKENIIVESYGGTIPSVEISALTGKGITELLDMILLVAEMEELKSEMDTGEGVVIESYMDSQKGPTSTVLIEKGIIKKGDYIGTESSVGKIKNLSDFLGSVIEKAEPSDPVIIVGFENVPMVGERMYVYQSIDEAKSKLKQKNNRIKIDDDYNEDKKYLDLIIKADALGSIEAIREILNILPQEKVGIRIIKAEVGDVSETDVKLARGSNAAIISFRMKTDKIAEITAEKENIKIHKFDIIYELSQKVRELMERKLVKEKERTELGKVNVLAIFRTEKNRQIVGGDVTEGEVTKGAMLEIWRNGEKVGSGKIVELQSGKKEVDVVKKGKESGILYQGSEKIKEGDELVIYKEEYIKEQL